MEATRLPKRVMFRNLVGGGTGKRADGISSRHPQSFQYQDRLMDDHIISQKSHIFPGQIR